MIKLFEEASFKKAFFGAFFCLFKSILLTLGKDHPAHSNVLCKFIPPQTRDEVVGIVVVELCDLS